jgi:hypothetical protein
MNHILEEGNGSILAAIVTGGLLLFMGSLFSGESELAEFVTAFLVTVGGSV